MHVAKEFVLDGSYIDPAKWSPLVYNSRHYFRLDERELKTIFREER